MLGSGAFGTVYRGVWLHKEGEESEQLVEEEVAVKTMEGGASEGDRIKFLQEAAIMGQFNHPNIIRLLGTTFEGKVRSQGYRECYSNKKILDPSLACM